MWSKSHENKQRGGKKAIGFGKIRVLLSTKVTQRAQEKYAKRIGILQTEMSKAEARKQSLEMKWLDGKLSDDDEDRLYEVINANIVTYNEEIASLQAIFPVVLVIGLLFFDKMKSKKDVCLSAYMESVTICYVTTKIEHNV